ncbi:MAG: aminotransferase class I/II-fold pyridoxal phosphate-dependent enzyme, partial [Gammaproteobacteria bacterium]|nr:aminotransferase class I/II-fold pyridoxal phosphate-dependent enzyme [Gammaproteobacteria bacterium]
MVHTARESAWLQIRHLQPLSTPVTASVFVDQVVEAIRQVAGPAPVALHEPRFAGNEWAYLKECLDSTFVSSVGKFVDRFEADLAAFTGARHAVAVVNGTAALHIALKLAGVEAGDEVLIPALTFVATANAVAYCGATCHFVDSEERTLGVDPHKLREYLVATTEQRNGLCVNRATGQVIRALVPMHTFGHPVELDGLLAVAHDFNLVLVEDAAESLGSYYHGRHTGTFGRFGTLSFNGNKTITTGGGGAILTNDPELARTAKHLTTTAKLPHRWAFEHD